MNARIKRPAASALVSIFFLALAGVGVTRLALRWLNREPGRVVGWPGAAPGSTQPVAAGGSYYLGGDANRPGAYSLTGKAITLRDVIRSDGVPDDVGPDDCAVIYRRSAVEDEVIKAELGPLLRDGTDDVHVRPNDIVSVIRAERGDRQSRPPAGR